MDSPLNLAHQQGRKADMMLKARKFEEAIACHNRAAEFLLEAMQLTKYQPALDSLRLQHAHHLKQTDQLYDRQRRAQILQIKQTKSQLCHQASQTVLQGPVIPYSVDQTNLHTFPISPKLDSTADCSVDPACPCDEDSIYRTLTENDSLIGLLLRRRQNLDGDNMNSFHSGVPVERVFHSKPEEDLSKSTKVSQEIQELRCHNEDLRKHVQQLLKEVEDVRKENAQLRDKWESTKTVFTDVMSGEPDLIPDLPPLEMPQFDFDLLDQQNKKFEEDNDSLLGKSPL